MTKKLLLRTDIKSKGGGTTEIKFEIGVEDIKEIIKEISVNCPNEFLGALTECSAEAYKASVRLSEETKKRSVEKQGHDIEIITDIVDGVNNIKKYCLENCIDSNQKEKIERVVNKLNDDVKELDENLDN